MIRYFVQGVEVSEDIVTHMIAVEISAHGYNHEHVNNLWNRAKDSSRTIMARQNSCDDLAEYCANEGLEIVMDENMTDRTPLYHVNHDTGFHAYTPAHAYIGCFPTLSDACSACKLHESRSALDW